MNNQLNTQNIMKRFLIALAVLLSVQVADAQVKSPAAAKKALDAAQLAAENPKKNTKVATWTKLASAYMDAYNAPYGNYLVNTPKAQLTQMMIYKPSGNLTTVDVLGQLYTKDVLDNKTLYFDGTDVLRYIEITAPVVEDPLAGALAAYAKAAELDVNGSKSKDILNGMQMAAAKYFEDGMTQYNLNNVKAAAALVAKAADASAMAPLSAPDQTYHYYAGRMYIEVEDYEPAKTYLEKCVEIGYYGEEGSLYPYLSNVYMKLGDEEKGIQVLEEGFSKFPEEPNILVGLINYYLVKEGGENKLLDLIEKAKKAMPDNFSVYRVEGNIYVRLGDYENAEKAYNKGIELGPDDPDGYLALGGYYIDRGAEYFNKAQETMDDKEWERLIGEYNNELIKSLVPLEKFMQIADEARQKDIAPTLRQVYFQLRNLDPAYMEKFEYYKQMTE